MTATKDGISIEALIQQLRRYAPYLPVIVGVQLLSTVLQEHPVVKNSWLLRGIFQNRFSFSTILALITVALIDMRNTVTEQFKDELNSYAGFSKIRDANNPFVVRQIGGDHLTFTDLDELAHFLGAMSAEPVPDRASRSFDAARRAVISGWNDAYLLRAAEFMATRSVEQSMHALFGERETSARLEHVASITETLKKCLCKDGTSKPGYENFVEFIYRALPKTTNLYETLEAVIQQRDGFAHRCEASNEAASLDLAPFQLARACLQYRHQMLEQSS
ncbi:hypothetical protein [Acidithiobacillus sp.]|uniref:hypothetical protein n=1 Tax=Acidithiobacillus sp. TaxID=1872118 RepID=UPI0031FEB5D7